MIYFRGVILTLFLLLVSGCGGLKVRQVSAVPGERFNITTSYDANFVGRQPGDRFAVSFVLPEGAAWTYYEMKGGIFSDEFASTENRGYLQLYGGSPYFNPFNVQWHWLNPGTIKNEWVDPQDWIMIPWYKDITPDIGARIPYTPREASLRYGDWYRLGYPQTMFKDLMEKGDSGIYCVRVVFNRSGSADWNPETEVMTIKDQDTSLYVRYECPFRTIDGLNALFTVDTGVRIYEHELKASHQVIDDRLDEIDQWLEPMWQSLVVSPDAYQFEQPDGAQQSIFCESYDYCW